MDRSDTNRTDAAQLLYARKTAAVANNTNTDITKALHDAMSIPKLTVVRQALLNELVDNSCTTSTTMNYDYATTFYNQLLMQTQTMEQHTENCLDEQRDDTSAVLDVAAVSSPLPLPLPLPSPSTLPSTTLPSPSSVSSSSSSSISYLEDNTEEEQGITCIYHDSSDYNENELSSYLGDSDTDNNNNNNNEEEREGEGDNSVNKGIDLEDSDPDPYAYKDDEEDNDNDEECDNVAVESICQE